MPKGSEELTNARKDEIINACAALYETMSFKEITLKEIGKRTSFTRTSIYNYFQTKEEIFLALMQREYEAWVDDLKELGGSGRAVTPETFSAGLARTVERRERLLKLMSMNLYDVEDNSRLENLVAFKTAYNHALQAVSACLRACFPRMGETEIREFIYAFFPFLFGIYPYTSITEKQREAMELAGVDYARISVFQITETFAARLLRGLGAGKGGAAEKEGEENGK